MKQWATEGNQKYCVVLNLEQAGCFFYQNYFRKAGQRRILKSLQIQARRTAPVGSAASTEPTSSTLEVRLQFNVHVQWLLGQQMLLELAGYLYRTAGITLKLGSGPTFLHQNPRKKPSKTNLFVWSKSLHESNNAVGLVRKKVLNLRSDTLLQLPEWGEIQSFHFALTLVAHVHKSSRVSLETGPMSATAS